MTPRYVRAPHPNYVYRVVDAERLDQFIELQARYRHEWRPWQDKEFNNITTMYTRRNMPVVWISRLYLTLRGVPL